MPIWMQMAERWLAMDMTCGLLSLCQNLTISGKVLTAHADGWLGWMLPFCWICLHIYRQRAWRHMDQALCCCIALAMWAMLTDT